MRGAIRWVACFAVILCGHSYAQSVKMPLDATHIGTPINLSEATWRIAIGDDPHYADPAFDDSQWKTFFPEQHLISQGYALPSGMWWHRLHVHVTPGSKNLAMTMTAGSYQIYVNGRLIGQQGGFPGRPRHSMMMEQVYPIPAEAVSNDSVVIAVREWFAPTRFQIDLLSGRMLLGDQKLLTDNRTVRKDSVLFETFGDVAQGIVGFMVGIWALALFRAQPENREYLWLAAMGLCDVFRAAPWHPHWYDSFLSGRCGCPRPFLMLCIRSDYCFSCARSCACALAGGSGPTVSLCSGFQHLPWPCLGVCFPRSTT